MVEAKVDYMQLQAMVVVVEVDIILMQQVLPIMQEQLE
jgi:hypothetical protein